MRPIVRPVPAEMVRALYAASHAETSNPNTLVVGSPGMWERSHGWKGGSNAETKS